MRVKISMVHNEEWLLAENKSGLLTEFISKAGRAFPAYLVMDDMGKITFEFPPRESTGGHDSSQASS